MTPTIIRFEPSLLARLRAAAARNGVSVACLVRCIVAEWFEAKDKKPNVMTHAFDALDFFNGKE